MDIPRIFNITESAHRIHNPITPEKLATLGSALRLEAGARVLDLGSGSGEMLCTWARDHGVSGTGIDMSRLFTSQAKLRAEELGVADRIEFIHADAAGYVADAKVGVAACVGATWIGGGVAGTIALLARSLRSGGIILIGEPYWLHLPPTEDVAKGCRAGSIADFLTLPELLASFGGLDYDPRRGDDDAFRLPTEVLVRSDAAPAEGFRPAGVELTTPRRAFACAALGGRAYLVGGLREDFDRVEDCEAFDFAARRFVPIAKPRAPRVFRT